MKKEKYIVVSKKKSGTYIMVKFCYSINGYPQQYSKSFNVKDYASEAECMKAACDHRDIKRAELLLHGLPLGTKRTVGQLLDDYFRIHKVTLGNQGVLKSRYDKYIAPKYDKIDVQKITALDIQTCLNEMIYESSTDTIRRVNGVWKDIMSTAILLGLLTKNPLDQVIIPKSQKITEKRNQSLSEDDFETILYYFQHTGRNEHDKQENITIANFLIVMAETGMRPAEISALEVQHINLENKIIHIAQSIRSSDKEYITVGKTKTDSSVRDVPMTSRCEEAIRYCLLHTKSKTFVFSDMEGNILTTKKISQHVNTVTKRLGIDFHLYMLRHRFSTKLVTNNVDPRTVMELMGHKNFSMTVSYARSDEEKKKKAIEENISDLN